MKLHSLQRTVFMKRQEPQLWFSMSHPMIMKATEGIILLKKAGTSTGTHKLPEEEFPTF